MLKGGKRMRDEVDSEEEVNAEGRRVSSSSSLPSSIASSACHRVRGSTKLTSKALYTSLNDVPTRPKWRGSLKIDVGRQDRLRKLDHSNTNSPKRGVRRTLDF